MIEKITQTESTMHSSSVKKGAEPTTIFKSESGLGDEAAKEKDTNSENTFSRSGRQWGKIKFQKEASRKRRATVSSPSRTRERKREYRT
jgi:hypothetical protein